MKITQLNDVKIGIHSCQIVICPAHIHFSWERSFEAAFVWRDGTYKFFNENKEMTYLSATASIVMWREDED